GTRPSTLRAASRLLDESTMDALAAIESWKRMSSELSDVSNDAVVPAISKAFEAICTVMRPQADPLRVERSLSALLHERNFSLQYDNQRDEPIRNLTYRLVDAVYLILSQLNAARNELVKHGHSNHTQTNIHSVAAVNPVSRTDRSLDAHQVDAFNNNDLAPSKVKSELDGEETANAPGATRLSIFQTSGLR
ncbi:hypothetical protein PFISCL1PPCAC_21505, partial [Pristionchus fissidentatus]